MNVGDQRHLVSIAQQKEANATLVGTKQDSMLLSNALLKGAIKEKVLLTLNSNQVATADRCADPQAGSRQLSVSTLRLSLCEPGLKLINANKAGEGLADS